MYKFINAFRKFHLMDPASDNPPPGNPPATPPAVTIESLQAEIALLKAKPVTPPVTPPADPGSPDLIEKARKEQEAKNLKASDTKALQAALQFTMNSSQFLKDNEKLLPKNIKGIFDAAEKENYETEIEKESAIKAGVVQEFFSQQANLDLLTPHMKTELEEYLKLSKNVKQDKAKEIYNMVFEPAFARLKDVKKAEALNKGLGNQTAAADAYKQKLVNGSKKHYLGEK